MKCTKCNKEVNRVRTKHMTNIDNRLVNCMPDGESWCVECYESYGLNTLAGIENDRKAELINTLYERLFTKYYHPNALSDWCRWDANFKGIDIVKMQIDHLLGMGFKVKTGYQSTGIRGINDRVIFYL